jgi:hypothetical protein
VHELGDDRAFRRFRRTERVVSRGIGAANEIARLYDHLTRKTAAEREVVDEAARAIARFTQAAQ